MGSKPSKTINDQQVRSLSNNTYTNRKRNQLKSVLRKKKDKSIQKQTSTTNDKDDVTPSIRTTEYNHLKKNIENDSINIDSNSSSFKRSSPHHSYDTSKYKKSRRIQSPISHHNHHLSFTSANLDIALYTKSNISSGCWTSLSNDPFSQIDPTTSTFTDITDHSTISRKSISPHLKSSISSSSLLSQLVNSSQSHIILKDAFDSISPSQLSSILDQYLLLYPDHNSTRQNVIVCLAKCHWASSDLESALDLLNSHPSAESEYALAFIHLDLDPKIAFYHLKKTIEYELKDDSVLFAVAEAQCLLARMYFQGEGVEQNSTKALYYLFKSAENHNPYAEFLIGVQYERGFELEKNIELAKEYYRKSAIKGLSDAQAALGCRLIAESNYKEGIEWLEKAIEKGNSRAHVQLGILHDKGEGTPSNPTLALHHYQLAAESDHPAAQYILGLIHYFGRLDQPQDQPKAIQLIQSSAKSGLAPAQRVIGQLQISTRPLEAVRWFKRAASQGDVVALAILGQCHETGIGLELDLEQALDFYRRAGEVEGVYRERARLDQARLLQRIGRHREAFEIYRGLVGPVGRLAVARYYLCRDLEGIPFRPVVAHAMLEDLVQSSDLPLAHYWLGSIYDEGIPDLFEVDRQKAFYHFKVAAEAGDNDAAFLVAYMMSNHVIPDKGPADAFPWYQKAAIKGHPTSMYSLGLCYYKGIGLEKADFDLALEWFEKASRVGMEQAVAYMARIYLKRMVLHQHQPESAKLYFTKAFQALRRASDHGDTYAQRELGKIYLAGKGVPVDYDMAVSLLTKAAVKNDPEAITFLGDCYHKGTGLEKDIDIAIDHYTRAAELGYPYAYSATAELYYEIGNMEYAYNYYALAAKEPRLMYTAIGKTARMMTARLALRDIPNLHPALLKKIQNPIRPEIAFEMLSTLAIQDQFEPAFQPLGNCYRYGKGTTVHLGQAQFWFRKAAEEHQDPIAYLSLYDLNPTCLDYLQKSLELGHPEAFYRMGILQLKDERVAAGWFRKAEGHPQSQWMLAKMAGSIQEYDLEFQYQLKAAALGHVEAMRALGQACLKRADAPFQSALKQQDYLEEGLRYLHQAADLEDTESLVLLGKIYNSCTKTRIRFANQHLPTPNDTLRSFSDEEPESRFQAEEDEKNLAIECFERASKLGDLNATLYAAEAWYEQKQYAAALELFQKAAAQNNVLARFFCARYLIEGYGGSPLDPEKGFKEVLICANELNCVHAYNTLAQCYENGIGTTKNDSLAYKWYLSAAEITHDAEAYYRIGLMYAQERLDLPDGSSHKDMEACKYFDLAINVTPNNHGPSCYQLGLYYLKGIETDGLTLLPADVSLSIEFFRTAADLDLPEAMLKLAQLFLNDDYSMEEKEEGLSRLQRASEIGLKEAQYELGILHHRGNEMVLHDDEEDEECVIVPQDFEKAYDLFCRAAAQRHPTATYYLGLYHQHGIFVAPDLSIALEQFETAVELFKTDKDAPDRWQAEFNLARILHQDIESRGRAYSLFQAAHLHAPDQYKFLSKIMIAKYHLHGWSSVPVQAQEAAHVLIGFAQEEQFGYRVYLEVAQCFEQGIGVEKNLDQAFHWYGEVIHKAHTMDPQQDFLSLMFLDEEMEEDEATAMYHLAEFYRKGLVVEQDLEKADDLYTLAAQKGSRAAQEYISHMLKKTKLHD